MSNVPPRTNTILMLSVALSRVAIRVTAGRVWAIAIPSGNANRYNSATIRKRCTLRIYETKVSGQGLKPLVGDLDDIIVFLAHEEVGGIVLFLNHLIHP